jgi:predicted GIY-YIG superfamily endonuclease
MFYVYILFSKKLVKTYTGYTSRNPETRLIEHFLGDTITTSKSDDWEIVWSGSFFTKELAKEFEKYLKTHSGRVLMNKRLIGDVMKTINHR